MPGRCRRWPARRERDSPALGDSGQNVVVTAWCAVTSAASAQTAKRVEERIYIKAVDGRSDGRGMDVFHDRGILGRVSHAIRKVLIDGMSVL